MSSGGAGGERRARQKAWAFFRRREARLEEGSVVVSGVRSGRTGSEAGGATESDMFVGCVEDVRAAREGVSFVGQSLKVVLGSTKLNCFLMERLS